MITSALFDQTVTVLDEQEESDALNSPTSAGDNSSARDIEGVNVQQQSGDDQQAHAQASEMAQFSLWFRDNPSIRDGARVKYTDAAGVEWVIVVTSCKEVAGRGQLWKAMGTAKRPQT